MTTALTPALCLLLALGVCAWADDFDFIYIPYNADPDDWSLGDDIPEDVRDSLFVLLFDEAGAERLRSDGCENLLRTYNDLRSGDFAEAAEEIRDLRSGMVHVYLIDDRLGLTDIMRAFAGPAVYQSDEGLEGVNYVWPSSRGRGHRAIHLGAFHIGEMMGYEEYGWIDWQSVILHELVHTTDDTMWLPYTIFITTSQGVIAPHTFESARMEDGYGSDRQVQLLEVFPNSRAAFKEGVASFVANSWSRIARRVYAYALTRDRMLCVEHDSDVQRLIGGNPDGTDTFEDTTYDYYYWETFPFEAQVQSEVLIALLLHYYAKHLPPLADGSDTRTGFGQVLHHFMATNSTDRTIITLVGSLLESASFSDQNLLTNHRMFVLGALDTITHFTADRSAMGTILGYESFIPSNQLGGLMDQYFGTESISGDRQEFRGDIEDFLPNLDDAMAALARRYDLPDYDFFDPDEREDS